MSRLKQLGKDSLIYGIGGIFAKGVSFLLLPVYTRIFTPAEYGTIEMLTVISNFLAAVLMMGMDSAQSMYFFKHKEEGQEKQARIVSSILQWRLVWGSVVIIIATLLAPLLNAALFNGKLGWEYFAISFAGTLFAQIMSQSAEVMRLLFRPLGFIGITLSQSLLSAALILIAVLIFEQGIFGYFLGTTVASISIALLGWFKIREYLTFDRLYVELWPQLLRFGAPLAPAGLAIYFMNTADRWFIQNYHGEQALGIFAVGAKFGMLISFAVETFRQAWWPIALNLMHNIEGGKIFRIITALYIAAGTTAMLFLITISSYLIDILFGDQYNQTWKIVGVIGWHSVFYGLYMIISAGIWKSEKTYLNLPIMILSLLIGLILNYLLVPKFGAMGAAIATSSCYGVWIAITYTISQRLWKINFPLLFGAASFIGSFVYTYYFINFGFKTPGKATVLAIVLSSMILIGAKRTVEKIGLSDGN